MASLSFDRSKPSHIIGAICLVLFAVFVIYELSTSPDIFATATIKAIALGSVYALIALGFVLIFKATEVVNFSQGALAMIGALFISFLVADENLPLIPFYTEWPNPIFELGGPYWLKWFLSVLLALCFAAVLGLVIERVAIRPMIGEPLF